MTEKERLMNKRKMKMDRKSAKRLEYQESEFAKNKIARGEEDETKVAPAKTENLFNDGNSDFRVNKELKYRTKDLNENKSEPRIKTKTRSKQKNLKKDKRSDEVKLQKFGEIKTGEPVVQGDGEIDENMAAAISRANI